MLCSGHLPGVGREREVPLRRGAQVAGPTARLLVSPLPGPGGRPLLPAALPLLPRDSGQTLWGHPPYASAACVLSFDPPVSCAGSGGAPDAAPGSQSGRRQALGQADERPESRGPVRLGARRPGGERAAH